MRLLVLLLITATLAGCADDKEPPTAFEPEEGMGVLHGVVVDASVTPLAGATVLIADLGLSAETDKDGKFVFLDIEPGSYFLTVSKPGFQTIQASATVEADDGDPPMIRVQLALDPTFIQLAETVKWEGIMNCQVGWNLGTGQGGVLRGIESNAANPCFSLNLAIPDTDRIVKQYEYESTPTYSQSEMLWTPSQTLAGFMSLMYTYTGGGGLDNYARSSGTGPLIVQANHTLLAEKQVGSTEPLIVRVFASSEDLLTVIAQQDFEVFTTTFYGFEPDEGWSYSVNGDHPLPSA